LNLHPHAILLSRAAVWGAVLCCILLPLRAAGAEPEETGVAAAAVEKNNAGEQPARTIGPFAEPIEQPAAPAEPPVVPDERTEEAAVDETDGAETAEPSKPKTLKFSFNYHPWPDVLRWFAEQNDLSLLLDTAPQGTFNYTDNREYTPQDAIDLLNSVLLTKGYTLVRRERMLFVVNLEDGIPSNLVPTVPVEDLDKRGEFELVSVVFPLDKLSTDEAEAEIGKLIGPPPGTVVALERSRQVIVTGTAGRLRVIRSMLQRIENPQGPGTGKLRSFDLEHALPEEILPMVRKLIGIAEDADAASDGSIRLAVDPVGGRLLVTGQSDKIAQIEEILEAIDVPAPGSSAADPATAESPQLEVYTVDTADPQSVLAVMQTLMEGMPDVRLAIDDKTNNLVALARPSQHATIKATLAQMQHDRRLIEVIHLRTVDPQVAVLSINKLFSDPGAKKDAPSTGGLQVDADPTTGQLFVRGTQSQIEQVRTLLEKMGEGEVDADAATANSTVRLLPLTGREAQIALQRAREIWPELRPNRIRVVTPSAAIPTVRPSTPSWEQLGPPERHDPALPRPHPQPAPQEPAVEPLPMDDGPPELPEPAATTRRSRSTRAFFAVQHVEAEPGGEPPPAPEIQSPFEPEASEAEVGAPATIVAIPGSGGLMIVSRDVEALNDFEELLHALAGEMMTSNAELTVFYLKHAKAAVVAETLNRIFGGMSSSSSSSAGGTAATAGDMSGVLGAMMGLGGLSITPIGSVSITPDTRLNALIVQANPADVADIEQLLKILDQRDSPEDVLAAPKARMIPLLNTLAEEIATIVKEVYRDRLTSSSGNRSGSGNSPQQFFQAMREMRGGGRSGGSNQNNQQDKMSVGVDSRTNSLVVVAADALFHEVKELAEQLDQAALESNQTMRVVTLGRASPAAVQEALSSLLGASIQTGNRSGSRGGSTSKPSSGGPQPAPQQPFFRPPFGGFRPGGQPPGGYRPQGSGVRPGGSPPGGSRPGGPRPGGSGR